MLAATLYFTCPCLLHSSDFLHGLPGSYRDRGMCGDPNLHDEIRILQLTCKWGYSKHHSVEVIMASTED